tara:strand:- start:475 stop:651 length:177 start_codon:yes stop_codon:yes gene_type:complete
MAYVKEDTLFPFNQENATEAWDSRIGIKPVSMQKHVNVRHISPLCDGSTSAYGEMWAG